jgi:hypothetical protein
LRLIREALSPRIQKSAASSPNISSTRSLCLPVQGAKTTLLFRHQLLDLLEKFPIEISLTIQESAVHISQNQLYHPMSSIPFVFLLPLSHISLLLEC